MTRPLGTHRPPLTGMPLDYRAFCQQHQHHYQRYAALLIHRPDHAHDTVIRALYDIALTWPTMLGAPNPAAAAWAVVKDHVHTATVQQGCTTTPPARREGEAAVRYLSSSLPADQRDIILLTWGLELTEEQISALTGLDAATITSCRLLAPRTPRAHRNPHPSLPANLPLDFEAFFTSWQEAFLSYALVRLHDRTHAEDTVLDAAEQMHRHWPDLMADLEPTAAAFRILRRTIDAPRTPRPTAEDSQTEDPLQQSLHALQHQSPLRADCVRLRHLAGLSYAQVGSLLGISQAAARTQTWTALRFLQDFLDQSATTQEQPR